MRFKVVAVTAGLSVPSSTRLLTDRLVEATAEAAKKQHLTVDFEVIELRELAMDLARVMVTGMPTDTVEAALDALENADAVVAVTPIFAGSYAGLFKTFFDLVGTERLAGTPVIVAATGGSARHSLALEYGLRPLFTAMRASTLATGVYAATDDFGAGSTNKASGSGLQSRIERAAAELVFAIEANSQPQALEKRHKWVSISEETAAKEAAVKAVGEPGRGATAALLKSDGTKGRLRPDLEDFVPMTDILG